MPLIVWISLALMATVTVAYLTGILIIEDILAFFSLGYVRRVLAMSALACTCVPGLIATNAMRSVPK